MRRIRLHDLRQTFASLLLQQRESLVYVKEEKGYSAITVDLYSHLTTGGNRQAVDQLEWPIGRMWDGIGPATLARSERQADFVGAYKFLNYCLRQAGLESATFRVGKLIMHKLLPRCLSYGSPPYLVLS